MKYPEKKSIKMTSSSLLALAFSIVAMASMHAVAEPLTVVESDNNGMSLLITADSDHDILSMTVRIVGPANFVFEDRIESASYEWIPPANLPDGNYGWEASVVTARPGAVNIDPPGLHQASSSLSSAGNQSDFRGGNPLTAEASQQQTADLSEVPIERFFRQSDKNVKTLSGDLRIRRGVLETIEDGDPIASTSEIGPVSRVVGALLDLLIPSAHAQTPTYDGVIIENDVNEGGMVRWQDSDGTHFNIRADATRLRVFDQDQVTRPFSIYQGSPTNSLVVRGLVSGAGASIPRVGIGTATPFADLHIRRANGAMIRLEDQAESSSWLVRNQNESRFEISAWNAGYSCEIDGNPTGCVSNAFTIELPNSTAQAESQDQAIYVTSSGNVGFGGEPDYPAHFHSALIGDSSIISLGNVLGVGTSEAEFIYRTSDSNWYVDIMFHDNAVTAPYWVGKGAPTHSLVIAADGNIGLGTDTPDHTVHAVSESGNAQIRVTETNGSNGLTMFAIENSGHPRFRLRNTTLDSNWDFRTAGSGNSEQFQITNFSNGTSSFPFRLFKNGDLEVEGDVTANGVLLTSTREAKTDFAPLDANDVLKRLSSLEISKWRYKHEDEGTVHFGPVAEEFHEIFGLSDGKHLNMIDTNGITFAAIQALNQQNQQLMTENSELMKRLERLESAINL